MPPKTQRALVLQGGGALGAYEVGVLKVLCDKLIEGNGRKEGPLFDIIAGTSIGAMNAAVLVSNIVNRDKTWEEAVQQLENFWTDDKEGLSSTPNYSDWWFNDGNDQNKVRASDEARRKYYSDKEYLTHGTPRVCTPPLIKGPDNKFGDQKDNLWFYHKSDPIEHTIVRYSIDRNQSNKKMKIATSMEKGQPRLLVISVDVAKGKTETFDSYHKESEDPKNSLYEGDGITIDHIMASGTLPIFYEFRKLGEPQRQFCDGGLLSNTPFRELLQAHKDYWLRIINTDKDKIPDLEVYIVNVHPHKGTTIQDDDIDGIKDRINDITFFDRNSHYDENVVNIITDYIEIIDSLKYFAKKYMGEDFEVFQKEVETFLQTTEAKSKSDIDDKRKYKDLLNCGFKLTNVVRIENTSPYDESIFGKIGDYTSKTIKDLIKRGEDDAVEAVKPKLNDPSNVD
jgi:NTE family protein